MNTQIRFLSAATLLIATLTTLSLATEIPPGPVTGDWYATGNPYNVNGEIYVPANNSLYIHEGVQVIFQGHYKFKVDSNATLQAIGTQQDSILFSALNLTEGWYGLRFLYNSSSSLVEYCIFKYGRSTSEVQSNQGGGIFCNYTNDLNVSHNTFENCSAHSGGGMYCIYSDPIIAENKFIENVAYDWGGGIYCTSSAVSIIGNEFIDNFSANDGGGIYIGSSSPSISIKNNIFIGNNAAIDAGAISCGSSNAEIINNTICNNSAGSVGGGIRFFGSTTSIVRNCIIWNNIPQQISGTPQVSFSCIQGGWSGTGNINANPLFVTGPEGDFYLSQIAAGQTQPSPCVDVGDPASPMIDGTTRTDGVQDQGVVDMGFHYALIQQPPPPPISITLTPYSPPIQIPPGGGAFNYNIAATNTQSFLVTCTVWCNATLPNGNIYGPTMGPTTITLPGSASLNRDRTQFVPNFAAPGNYIYHAYIGTYPDSAWDTDAFTFTKLGSGDSGSGAGEWLCTGSPFPGEETARNEETYNLSLITYNLAPNPFNPTTVASFELRVASQVSLRVYDTAGRLVETLVDGWREAGEYRATFDGSGLPSGVYLYRLEASGSGAIPTTVTGKMVLLK